jgi:hypothetical protein
MQDQSLVPTQYSLLSGSSIGFQSKHKHVQIEYVTRVSMPPRNITTYFYSLLILDLINVTL